MQVISTLETRRSVVGVTENEPETKSAKPVTAFSMQSAASRRPPSSNIEGFKQPKKGEL
jgi:hypothetical protein